MEKTFDCLKMKEEIQTKIYEETKDMSSSEILVYFNKKSQNSALWQRLIKDLQQNSVFSYNTYFHLFSQTEPPVAKKNKYYK